MRVALLSAAVVAVTLAGCTQGSDEGSDAGGQHSSSKHVTATRSPESRPHTSIQGLTCANGTSTRIAFTFDEFPPQMYASATQAASPFVNVAAGEGTAIDESRDGEVAVWILRADETARAQITVKRDGNEWYRYTAVYCPGERLVSQ